MALLCALRYGAMRDVNVFTDSSYAYLVVHRDLEAWLRTAFQTADGKPFKHKDLEKELVEAIKGPREEP